MKEMSWLKTLVEYDVDFSTYAVKQNELALTDVNSNQYISYYYLNNKFWWSFSLVAGTHSLGKHVYENLS
jgi:hypothetical protein